VIDPDEEPSPELEAPPAEPPGPPIMPAAPAADRLQRWVAVFIMVVSLLGAVFAFLQTAASNRAARAARRADTEAVETLARLAEAATRIAAENRIWELAAEDGVVAAALAGADGEEAPALVSAYYASRDALLAFTDLARPEYQVAGGGIDWPRFVQDSLAPSGLAAEYREAYAAQRDGWAAKGGTLVVVITVLAVALFLIGLSRTPVALASGVLLVGAGTALAAVAGVWGLVTFARPVAAPSPEAIEAYVEGQVAYFSASGIDDLEIAEAAFTAAVAARPDYSDAYYWRAGVRLTLDFSRPEGPVGSEGARDDLARVVSLDPLNAVAWNDLAAARFWLGDLEGAVGAIRTSLRLDPGNLLANLNLSAFLLLGGDTAGYESQMAVAADLVAGGSVPDRHLQYVAVEAHRVLDVAERYRPEYAALIPRLRADFERVLGVDL